MSKGLPGVRDNFGVIRPYPMPGSWIDRGACLSLDPDIFYPHHVGYARAARSICSRCPVAAECLDYALACEALDPYGGHGIWAGLSGKERNRLRDQIRQQQHPSTGEPA